MDNDTTTYLLKGILLNNKFSEETYVSVNAEGIITGIEKSYDGEGILPLDAYAIPGFQNAHSHAFQYAMAGLAEKHSTAAAPDDFWSWRAAMYQLALAISPDDLEAIATMLYAEMLRHGYTNVAEFHYVHHSKNGTPFNNLAEMGERLVRAAKKVGLGITLVPIFYQNGGFGKPPVDGQKRFISKNLDTYLRLLEASNQVVQEQCFGNVAIGIHSMRGVEPSTIAEIAKNGPQNLPFHIHIAEQLKEIEDAKAYLGKRPVEWMLDNVAMSDRFHLVHATHLTNTEVDGIADSGANVVLCPTTEGNLGDGIFPLKRFQEKGGKWSVGTDSHIGLSPLEELRLLDYGQRLISHKRNTFYSKEQGDSGLYAMDMALRAGRKAMNNFNGTSFSIGEEFNAVLFDAQAPLIATTSRCNLPSTIIYAGDASMQLGTISKGKLVVTRGRHLAQEAINNEFIAAIKKLKNRM